MTDRSDLVDTVAEAIRMSHMTDLGMDTYRRMAQAAIDAMPECVPVDVLFALVNRWRECARADAEELYAVTIDHCGPPIAFAKG